MTKKEERDIEKVYSIKEFVAKLRRLADALELGNTFSIQIAGERIRIPASASISIEHERSETSEEVEFQLKWELREVDDEENEEEQNDDEDEEQKADEEE